MPSREFRSRSEGSTWREIRGFSKGDTTYYLLNICGGNVLAIPLMLITTGDVLSRSFFNKPIPGTLELSEYMLSIIILLGAAYTQQVKVTLVWCNKIFSKDSKGVLEIFTTLASMFIVVIIVWQGYVEEFTKRPCQTC